jgi:hypothetical protein
MTATRCLVLLVLTFLPVSFLFSSLSAVAADLAPAPTGTGRDIGPELKNRPRCGRFDGARLRGAPNE